jgi:hypothetical protein
MNDKTKIYCNNCKYDTNHLIKGVHDQVYNEEYVDGGVTYRGYYEETVLFPTLFQQGFPNLKHSVRRLIYRFETEFGLKWDGVFRCHFPDRSALAT